MNKILFIIIIIVIIGLFFVGGVFAYENKYLWAPISEEALRQKVSDFYYLEIENESCVLNNYNNFNSKEDCQNAVKCISDKLSAIVPSQDLRRLVNNMKEGEHAESAVISYFQQHNDVEVQYRESLKDCLIWVAK